MSNKTKELKITTQHGKEASTALLLQSLGYDVYSNKRDPAYLAALVFAKCEYSQLEIIKLITKYYPIDKKEK